MRSGMAPDPPPPAGRCGVDLAGERLPDRAASADGLERHEDFTLIGRAAARTESRVLLPRERLVVVQEARELRVAARHALMPALGKPVAPTPDDRRVFFRPVPEQRRKRAIAAFGHGIPAVSLVRASLRIMLQVDG